MAIWRVTTVTTWPDESTALRITARSIPTETLTRPSADLPMCGPTVTRGRLITSDRHIVLYGVNEPADFYNPDYSSRQPDAPADYRRTLYWNPNARTDADGRFMATFFNNGKETRIKVSVAGITDDGKFVY